MRAVNLLPEEGLREQSETGPVTSTAVAIGGAALLGLVVIFLAVVFLQSSSSVSSNRDELTDVQAQVAKAKADRAAAESAAAASGAPRSTRIEAFTAATAVRVPWDQLLDDISRVLPRGTWLSGVTAEGGTFDPGVPASATAPPPTAFSITGLALSQNLVAQTIQRLSLIPMLSNVTLQSSSQTSIDNGNAYQFTMSANLRAPEVSR